MTGLKLTCFGCASVGFAGEDVLGEHALSFTDSRILTAIDGVDAAVWLRNKKQELGLSAFCFT